MAAAWFAQISFMYSAVYLHEKAVSPSSRVVDCLPVVQECAPTVYIYLSVISSKIWNKRLKQFIFLIHLERLFAVVSGVYCLSHAESSTGHKGCAATPPPPLGIPPGCTSHRRASSLPSPCSASQEGCHPFCPSGPGIRHFRKGAALPGSEGGGQAPVARHTAASPPPPAGKAEEKSVGLASLDTARLQGTLSRARWTSLCLLSTSKLHLILGNPALWVSAAGWPSDFEIQRKSTPISPQFIILILINSTSQRFVGFNLALRKHSCPLFSASSKRKFSRGVFALIYLPPLGHAMDLWNSCPVSIQTTACPAWSALISSVAHKEEIDTGI